MTWIPLPAQALVDYNHTSGISGEASVNKVGALLLASGLAVMSGTSIQITSKGETQLQGQLFKMVQSGSKVQGSAYFDQGPGLGKLNSALCDEYVDLLDGNRIKGAISAVTAAGLTCGGQSIAMSSVKAIHSARVMNFTTQLGEAPKMNFESTCVKLAASTVKQPPAEHSWKKIIITGLCVCAIATAITLPIVIPLACGGNNHNNDNVRNAVIYNNYVNSRKPPVVVSSGSGP
jgi:hypothetical protein